MVSKLQVWQHSFQEEVMKKATPFNSNSNKEYLSTLFVSNKGRFVFLDSLKNFSSVSDKNTRLGLILKTNGGLLTVSHSSSTLYPNGGKLSIGKLKFMNSLTNKERSVATPIGMIYEGVRDIAELYDFNVENTVDIYENPISFLKGGSRHSLAISKIDNVYFIADGNSMYSIDSHKISDKICDYIENMLPTQMDSLNKDDTLRRINMFVLMVVLEKAKQNKQQLYTEFQIPKTDGSMRTIHEPSVELKEVMKFIGDYLTSIVEIRLTKYGIKENINGYTRNAGIKSNANLHKDNPKIVKLDIKDFFNACEFAYSSKTLAYVFGRKLYLPQHEKDTIKEAIYKENGVGLYMGNPISCSLTNLIMIPVIKHIKNILDKKDICVSAYSDDITFSGSKTNPLLNVKYLKFITNEAFEAAGLTRLKLKDEKEVVMFGNKRRITGVRINHNNELTVDREHYRFLRTLFHNRRHKPEEFKISFEAALKLVGQIEHYKYIDESGKFNRLLLKYKKEYESIKKGINSLK